MWWWATLATAEPTTIDTRCDALRAQLEASVAAIRKGRVEVSACARIPGVRAVVVLQTARGGIGDPVVATVGPENQRLKEVGAIWASEPLVFAGDRGDPRRLVAEAIVPLRPDQILTHPAAAIVDLVVAEPPAPDDPTLVLARHATGYDIRAWTPETWALARAAARTSLAEALSLTDEIAGALVDAGALSPADVASMSPDALLAPAGNDRARARAWVDAAAWWSEYEASPGGARRGW